MLRTLEFHNLILFWYRNEFRTKFNAKLVLTKEDDQECGDS